METSLHRQLKELYAADAAQREVTLHGYRIDAVQPGRLVEIQCASLGAIRDKVRQLLASHDVLVVKPLAASKQIVRRSRRNGPVASQRRSPQRMTIYHVFLDLVHFVTVFPHPRLTLEVVLTDQEEWRVPAASRRWRSKGYRVEDRRLLAVGPRYQFQTAAELLQLVPDALADGFTTADLATATGIPRWLAQKMAYCLRHCGALALSGKTGHSLRYVRPPRRRRAA